MSVSQAIKIIESNKTALKQFTELLPPEFEVEEAEKFMIEFAEAILEV